MKNDTVIVEIQYADASFHGKFDVDHNSRPDLEILEDVRSQWNVCSSATCSEFQHAHCRSLAPGDFVKIGEAQYRLEECAWRFVPATFVTNWFIELNHRVGQSSEPTVLARWTASLNMGLDLETGTLNIS